MGKIKIINTHKALVVSLILCELRICESVNSIGINHKKSKKRIGQEFVNQLMNNTIHID